MENSYQIPELSEKLAQIAENMLPKFSNRNKVLQVLVRFNYDKPKEKLPLGVVASPHEHIKIVFWHPGNSMLVGYDFETMVENIFDNFIISANHSSTWKHDGLDFFHKILMEPKSWNILKSTILDIKNPNIRNNEFTFSLDS